MRLWHLVLAILVAALVLSLARDPAGRVGLIVFVVGLGEAVSGTMALMALFQTIASIGEANGLADHARAVIATTVVLAVAGTFMAVLVCAGAWLVVTAVA